MVVKNLLRRLEGAKMRNGATSQIIANGLYKEATVAMSYAVKDDCLEDSLLYELLEIASKADSLQWGIVEDVFRVFDEGMIKSLKFEDIEKALSPSPVWAAKKAIIKLALEAVKGTK